MKKLIALGGIFWIVAIAGLLWIANYKAKPQAAPVAAAPDAPKQSVACIPATWTLETFDAKGNPVRQHVATWGPSKDNPVAFCFLPNGEVRWLVPEKRVATTQVQVGTDVRP